MSGGTTFGGDNIHHGRSQGGFGGFRRTPAPVTGKGPLFTLARSSSRTHTPWDPRMTGVIKFWGPHENGDPLREGRVAK